MHIKSKKEVGAIVHKSGVLFRVWAPFAGSVAVTGSFNNWSETPMDNEQDGYWWTFVKGAKSGQEYKFAITNGDKKILRNDPRALHFTTTSGNSVIASDGFDWEGVGPVNIPKNQAIIYELHVGTFNRADPATTGTFHSVVQKLDYLAELGINTIELMPISSMVMDRGWGYAIDYIFAIESLYGGRHGLLKFVKAAHQRGIAVIIDVVYNHFGPDEYLDLWQFDGWHQDNMGGIYFYNDWRAVTPWGNTRPDFGRREVMQYLLDNVRMWMHDCQVDGLRVDSTIYIRNVNGYNDDRNGDLPEGWQLLQQINDVALKVNPSALMIGEDIAINEYITKPTSEGGAGFSAQWELNFPHALREALSSDDPSQINFSGVCGELGKRFNGDAFQRVIYIDSHDSAANGGSRFNEVIAPGKSSGLFARKQSLIAAAILMTSPGIPMLFQGQEFLESGYFNDWQALDWEKPLKFAGFLQAYKDLIALRKNTVGTTGGLSGEFLNLIQVDETNKVIAYHRWGTGGPKDDVVVIINFGKNSCSNYVFSFPRNGKWKVRFNSTDAVYSPDFKNAFVPDLVVDKGEGLINLPPSCALIFSQDD